MPITSLRGSTQAGSLSVLVPTTVEPLLRSKQLPQLERMLGRATVGLRGQSRCYHDANPSRRR